MAVITDMADYDTLTDSEKLERDASRNITPNKGRCRRKKDAMAGTTVSGDTLHGSVFYASGAFFTARFDTLFKLDSLSVFNTFDLSGKRNFKNTADVIVDAYNSFFLDNGGRLKPEPAFMLTLQKILYCNSRILTASEPIKLGTFIDKYLASIISPELIGAISEYVDNLYVESQDKAAEWILNSGKARKKIDALRLTDAHFRIILKISTLNQILIPLISQYLLFNSVAAVTDEYDLCVSDDSPVNLSTEIEKYNHVILKIFYYMFDTFDKTGEVKQIIYKNVESRVLMRRFSDRGFWAIADAHGVGLYSFSQEVFEKLIWNSIAKLSINKQYDTIVPYFQSVINNSIDYLLSYVFRIKISTSNLNNTPEEDEYTYDDSDYDKVEMSIMRKDEGMSVLRRINIDDSFSKVRKKFGLTTKEFEISSNVVNDLQKKILGLFVNKYFGDSTAIEYFTLNDYNRGISLLHEYLLKMNFKILPKLLIATCETVKDKQMSNDKRIRPQMLDSKLLSDILSKSYGNTCEIIKGPLISTIATIYVNDFYINGDPVITENVKVENIALEFLEFIRLLA